MGREICGPNMIVSRGRDGGAPRDSGALFRTRHRERLGRRKSDLGTIREVILGALPRRSGQADGGGCSPTGYCCGGGQGRRAHIEKRFNQRRANRLAQTSNAHSRPRMAHRETGWCTCHIWTGKKHQPSRPSVNGAADDLSDVTSKPVRRTDPALAPPHVSSTAGGKGRHYKELIQPSGWM